MNLKSYITELLPKVVLYKLTRKGYLSYYRPITLTFSVTNRCQSRCKTCLIWKLYQDDKTKVNEELTLNEIEKIFQSLGHIYFFNVSGGEPFLRRDLPEIFELAIRFLAPKVLHIPTNGLSPDRILRTTQAILEKFEKYQYLKYPLTIKPSYDGVGALHDEIRGVAGNFQKLNETLTGLKEIAKAYPNLHVEIGTVISNFNKDHLEEIAQFAKQFGVESYRNEIAEQREEFFNIGDPITPTAEEYLRLIEDFVKRIKENLHEKRELTQLTESFRLVYYQYAGRILKEKRQVLPCYAGISNVHLNPYGELWPCCVLAYKKPLGNFREFQYDFQRLINSAQANSVLKYIREEKCYCPLANQAYSNIMIDFEALSKVFATLVGTRLK